MPETLPAWAIIAVGVVIGIVKLLIDRWDKKEKDSLNVETNPDDHDSVADFDERERMRNPGELPPES